MADKKELNTEEMENVAGGIIEIQGEFKPFISVQQNETPPLNTNLEPANPSGGSNTNTINQNNNNNNQGIQSNQQGGSGTQKNVQSIDTKGNVNV